MYKKILFFIFIAAYTLGTAQESYTLVYYRGQIEQGNGKNWEPLTTIGKKLDPQQKIKVNDKSEAIFQNAKGEIIYLKQPGSFATKDFGKYMTHDNGSGFTSYYLKYVAGQVTHTEQTLEGNYKANMSNLGGVSRGRIVPTCLLRPFDKSTARNQPLLFTWKPFGGGEYGFILYKDSLLDEVQYGQQVKDTFLLLDPEEAKLNAGQKYFWLVNSKIVSPCTAYSFRILTVQEATDIDNEHSKLMAGLQFSAGTNKMLESAFFESKGLLNDAYQCILEACRVEPDNAIFENLRKNLESYPSN